jgi:hypothetical protein
MQEIFVNLVREHTDLNDEEAWETVLRYYKSADDLYLPELYPNHDQETVYIDRGVFKYWVDMTCDQDEVYTVIVYREKLNHEQ